jgi:hypothetical protein
MLSEMAVGEEQVEDEAMTAKATAILTNIHSFLITIEAPGSPRHISYR